MRERGSSGGRPGAAERTHSAVPWLGGHASGQKGIFVCSEEFVDLVRLKPNCVRYAWGEKNRLYIGRYVRFVFRNVCCSSDLLDMRIYKLAEDSIWLIPIPIKGAKPFERRGSHVISY